MLLCVGEDAKGPLAYKKDGVELNGKTLKWKDLSSIEDTGGGKIEIPQDLIEPVVADGWNRDAIKKLKPILEKREPETTLRPPFEGRWLAVVDKTGHHQIKIWAITAIDFVKVDGKGFLYKTDAKTVEDFHGWGQPVYAAADGDVSYAIDTFPDMPVNKSGKFEEANIVTIHHTREEATTYCHLKKGSVTVKQGDKVKRGQKIGEVGNSGASGLPHLHFAMILPVYAKSGTGQYVGIPYRFEECTLVEANKTACKVKIVRARPQEGWVLECPKP